MLSNIYKTKDGVIATPISGDRPHFPYRLPEHASEVYEYELSYGENFHTLSSVIFGTDELWYVIQDLNKPLDAFRLGAGVKVLLPMDIVKNSRGIKKFF